MLQVSVFFFSCFFSKVLLFVVLNNSKDLLYTMETVKTTRIEIVACGPGKIEYNNSAICLFHTPLVLLYFLYLTTKSIKAL